ncbi:MAG TPA: hypothetical protein VH062_10245 [Polyangiaceae bacterium]|jgi:hypothetical protein|nr:hypothetical protein [Polyangiaceae bacterium]
MKNPFGAKKMNAAEPLPPAPPVDDVERLTAQLDASRVQHAEMLAAEETARAKYRDVRDELTYRALEAAKAGSARALEDLGCAEADLGAAREAKAASVRATQEKLREELAASLSRDAVIAAAQPLAQQHADLLVQVATIQVKRVHLAVELQGKAHELRSVMSALGMPISEPVLVGQSHVFTTEGAHVALADGPDMVADLVERTLSGLPPADPRRAALEALKPSRLPTRV